MKKEYILYCIAVVLLVTAVVVLYFNISYPWLWYDEAGQFWISKGLNHYSDPLTETKGIMDVIDNNRYYNMDPGGFSILLHFWTLISNSYVFIRLLPLLFFVGFACFFYLVLREYSVSKPFAIICALLLFLWPITTSRMVELRAYSMSLMGLTWAVYYLKKCEDKNYSIPSLLMLCLGIAFFCTSRYEYIIFAFPFSLYTLYLIFKHRSGWFGKYLVYGCPLLIMVLAIMAITLQYQNSSVEKVSYLHYLSDDFSLYHGKLFLFYIINIIIVLTEYRRCHHISQLQLISLICPSIFIILSILGLYPWDSIRTMSVIVITFLNFVVFVYNRFPNKEYIKIAIICGVMISIGGTHPINKTEYNKYLSFINMISRTPQKIYVDDWFSPSVRYHYEYGDYHDRSKKDRYPQAFIFQKWTPNHSGKLFSGIFSVMPNDYSADYYLIDRQQDFAKKTLMQVDWSDNVFVKK